MRVLVLYRPNSEHETAVESFARELEHRTGHKLEMVSLDTREGADQAGLYDVTRYPAILAVKDDGQLLQLWQEDLLPTISEVSGYFNQ